MANTISDHFHIPATCSLKEASQYLHLSYRVVQQYVYDGKLTAWKVGRHVRISMADIADFYKKPMNAAVLNK